MVCVRPACVASSPTSPASSTLSMALLSGVVAGVLLLIIVIIIVVIAVALKKRNYRPKYNRAIFSTSPLQAVNDLCSFISLSTILLFTECSYKLNGSYINLY